MKSDRPQKYFSVLAPEELCNLLLRFIIFIVVVILILKFIILILIAILILKILIFFGNKKINHLGINLGNILIQQLFVALPSAALPKEDKINITETSINVSPMRKSPLSEM